jgi:hypothetical protein
MRDEPKKPRKTNKGRFTPKNPKKYKGDPTNIVYRSSWEHKVMRWLDSNSAILQWASEEIIVPYYDPTEGRNRRYFPDFVVVAKGANGKNRILMLEVKPEAQTIEPKLQKRKTERYLTEVKTWGTNQAKWKAAREFCEIRGWEFHLVTEKSIFGVKKR